MARVLVVKGDPLVVDALAAALTAAGFDVDMREESTIAEPADPVLTTDAFTIDLASMRVTKAGRDVHLTPTEWGILEILVRHRGKLVGQADLLTQVWGASRRDRTHYLRVYLGQLRRKLEDNPARPKHLITETGMGYRLVV